MSEHNMASAVRRSTIRVFLASPRTSSAAWDACQQLSAQGYEVETAGIEETLWLWPLEGYDILLVDASKQPQPAIDLCHLVRNLSPRQRIVLMLGERTFEAPRPPEADAIVDSIATQFLPAVHLLVPRSRAATACGKKPVQSAHVGVERGALGARSELR